jgi:hypothetical protein
VIGLCKPAAPCIHCGNVCSVSLWIDAAIDGCSKNGVVMSMRHLSAGEHNSGGVIAAHRESHS